MLAVVADIDTHGPLTVGAVEAFLFSHMKDVLVRIKPRTKTAGVI